MVFQDYFTFAFFLGENVSAQQLFHILKEIRLIPNNIIEFGKHFRLGNRVQRCGVSSPRSVLENLSHTPTLASTKTNLTYIDSGSNEEYGKTLIYISGNNSEPQRISYDIAMGCGTDKSGWIFVGDKKEEKKTAEIYREAIYALSFQIISAIVVPNVSGTFI